MHSIFARLHENQSRASELREELARSVNAKAVLPWLFRKGSFTLDVTGKRVKFHDSKVPYKASIVYKSCGTEVALEYDEWCVLSRQYYSPDVHAGIKRHWNFDGI